MCQNTGVTLAVPGTTRPPVSEHRSYTGSPRDYQPPWHLCVRVSHNTGVTLAVSGLSQDWYPYEIEEVKLLKLHRQSQDYPRTTNPLGPLCQSIPEHQSYTGSPRITSTQGLLDLLTPLCQSIPECQQSQDYPGTTNAPGTPM